MADVVFTRDDIIDLKQVKQKGDGEYVKGLVLVKEYKKKVAKNNSNYYEGVLELGGAIQFKSWGSSPAFTKLDEADYTGMVSSVCAKVNHYGGVVSLIIEDLFAADLTGSGIEPDDFLADGYDGEAYFRNLKKALSGMVSPSCVQIFDMIVDKVEKRFKLEYAAKGMHDNCRGGLIAHTYKVLYISRILKLYPNILQFEGDMDLIGLGIVLHDIGKVKEYLNGSIVGNGLIVSHHTFGVEMLFEFKEKIIELKGEEFFYRLCSIIEQHHGVYEETPRTIEAYIIHKLDSIESSLQFLNQSLEGFDKGNQLNIDNFKLV